LTISARPYLSSTRPTKAKGRVLSEDHYLSSTRPNTCPQWGTLTRTMRTRENNVLPRTGGRSGLWRPPLPPSKLVPENMILGPKKEDGDLLRPVLSGARVMSQGGCK
jgi:hypothetical protein